MVHRCPSSMWYLCIHCTGRVIDVLMQPEYRKCWRPTWLAKLWVFNTMPVQSLATHERRNEHYTAGMFFWECKGLLWILISPFILHLPTKKACFQLDMFAPTLQIPRSFSAVERKMNFSKLSRTSLGFESVPKASLIYFCAWETSTKSNLSHFLGKLLTQFCYTLNPKELRVCQVYDKLVPNDGFPGFSTRFDKK